MMHVSGRGPVGLAARARCDRHADAAVNLAVVEYETEDLEPPILSVEDAVKKSSLFDIIPFLYPQQVGDTSKGMAEADHQILSSEVCNIVLFYCKN